MNAETKQRAFAKLDASIPHLAEFMRLAREAKTDAERRTYAATGYFHATAVMSAFFELGEIVEPRK